MIRIHRQVDSTTLHLPELEPLVGKTVQIVIRESPSQRAAIASPLALQDDGIDPDVCATFRPTDQQQGADLF
jgi:hypothetical protein